MKFYRNSGKKKKKQQTNTWIFGSSGAWLYFKLMHFIMTKYYDKLQEGKLFKKKLQKQDLDTSHDFPRLEVYILYWMMWTKLKLRRRGKCDMLVIHCGGAVSHDPHTWNMKTCRADKYKLTEKLGEWTIKCANGTSLNELLRQLQDARQSQYINLC